MDRAANTHLAVKLDLCLESLRFLVRDQDYKYTKSFDAVLQSESIEVLRTPPRSPRMNAHGERVIQTPRQEVLDHILIWNETHARHILAQHYNGHRPHQARQQRPPLADNEAVPLTDPSVPPRLLQTRVPGGLINEYRYSA